MVLAAYRDEEFFVHLAFYTLEKATIQIEKKAMLLL
jgi:hypothetical protein